MKKLRGNQSLMQVGVWTGFQEFGDHVPGQLVSESVGGTWDVPHPERELAGDGQGGETTDESRQMWFFGQKGICRELYSFVVRKEFDS